MSPKAAAPKRRKRAKPATVGLAPGEVAGGSPPDDVQALRAQIEADGGAVLSAYREPYGATWILFASLPIERVAPTPFQREISKAHAERLEKVITKLERFLDPLIAVRALDGYWTPNGMHRLEALRRLGAKAVTALVLPDPAIAYRILALNTEKAHNLKDKSLEVIRMARELGESSKTSGRPESDWAFEFEDPSYLTLGLCYEENTRFSGGAYHSVLRRCEEFSEAPIGRALTERKKHAEKLLALDERVAEIVQELRAAGLQSAYLKPFVVARLNPLRFVKAAKPGQKAPRADFDGTLDKMLASARKFDATKVRPQDLAAMGGAPAEEG
jgi:ParB family chromosome partitioning protein